MSRIKIYVSVAAQPNLARIKFRLYIEKRGQVAKLKMIFSKEVFEKENYNISAYLTKKVIDIRKYKL